MSAAASSSTMAAAIGTVQDDSEAINISAVSLPYLPNELWLQILEQLDDIEFLWCTVRLVSKDYKAFVDRVFAASFLPIISLSLSLPRRDPKTGHLRYAHALPQSEIVLHCHSPNVHSSHISLTTPAILSTGDIVEQLTESGALSKQRLDEAQAWMWFGRQRGKGANVTISKDIQWNEERNTWMWTVQWEILMHRYFSAKRASRQVQRGNRKDVGISLRLR